MQRSDTRPRILVVDDDLGSRTLTAIVLTEAGYSPVSVPTVARAVERLAAADVDVVLTDLLMPGVGGLELIRILRTWADAPPVVAMTGSDDDELVAAARELGAAAVLRKPVTIDALADAIGAALGNRRAAA
jgi:CheY-like chemotaxis protein